MLPTLAVCITMDVKNNRLLQKTNAAKTIFTLPLYCVRQSFDYNVSTLDVMYTLYR